MFHWVQTDPGMQKFYKKKFYGMDFHTENAYVHIIVKHNIYRCAC